MWRVEWRPIGSARTGSARIGSRRVGCCRWPALIAIGGVGASAVGGGSERLKTRSEASARERSRERERERRARARATSGRTQSVERASALGGEQNFFASELVGAAKSLRLSRLRRSARTSAGERVGSASHSCVCVRRQVYLFRQFARRPKLARRQTPSANRTASKPRKCSHVPYDQLASGPSIPTHRLDFNPCKRPQAHSNAGRARSNLHPTRAAQAPNRQATKQRPKLEARDTPSLPLARHSPRVSSICSALASSRYLRLLALRRLGPLLMCLSDQLSADPSQTHAFAHF